MRASFYRMILLVAASHSVSCVTSDDRGEFYIDPPTQTVKAGDKAVFTPMFPESDGFSERDLSEIVWESGDERAGVKVVGRETAWKEGEFQALRPGTVGIKATYRGQIATAVLTVEPAPPPSAGIAPTVRVSTAAELAALLATDFKGTLFIPGDVTMDLTGYRDLPLKSGVTLRSDRGGTRRGALLHTRDLSGGESFSLFDVVGGDVLVEGLRFEGPSRKQDEVLLVSGVQVLTRDTFRKGAPRNIVIRGNEFSGWSMAGVTVSGPIGERCYEDLPSELQENRPDEAMRRSQAGEILVTGNFFHDNLRNRDGYGVAIIHSAYATVLGNVFDRNRHAVFSDGRPFSGYIARGNYQLSGALKYGGFFGYYNQIFDVHGCGPGGYGGWAGEYAEVAYNTVLADESYAFGHKNIPDIWVRGTPREGLTYLDNTTPAEDRGDAIRYDGSEKNLNEHDNRFGEDHSLEMAVGDFDGDGRDDVFVATGSAWYFSSGGVAPWTFLAASRLTLKDLGFGDFDHDGCTDVFYRGQGGRWRYFSGQERKTKADLLDSDVPASKLLFGDFDGDGFTDAFLAEAGRWRISWRARKEWETVNASGYGVEDLRLGDFDGDGRTDVFGVEGGHWAWVPGARGPWRKLGDFAAGSLRGFVLGDFDGDGRTDVAWESPEEWNYSPGGQANPLKLRAKAIRPRRPSPTGGRNLDQPYDHIEGGVVGRFTAGATARRSAFLRYEEVALGEAHSPRREPVSIGARWASWVLGASAGNSFTIHSWQEMR